MTAMQSHPDVAKGFSIRTVKNPSCGQRPAARYLFLARPLRFRELNAPRICHVAHQYQVRRGEI